MNKIRINGMSIVGGRNITITNGRVVIDGKDVTGDDTKTINIEIHGDVAELSADVCNTIAISGSAGKVKTQSGDIHCGDVSGSIQTMSGDVSCGAVAGDVSTMSGDISRR